MCKSLRGKPDREAGDVMRDAVEAQRGLLAADFHGLARIGVHAAGESDGAAELFELIGRHPGIRHLAVILQQRVQAAAIAVVRDAMTQDVLDEIHLVREQVARLAGAVSPVTAPVPEVPLVPGNLRRRPEPEVPVHLLDHLGGIGTVPLAVVAVPTPHGMRRVAAHEAARAHERDRAQDALRDQFLRLQGGGALPRMMAKLEDHLALLDRVAHEFRLGQGVGRSPSRNRCPSRLSPRPPPSGSASDRACR